MVLSVKPNYINGAEVAVSDRFVGFLETSDNSSCPWSINTDTRCMSCIPFGAPKLYPGHQGLYQNKHGSVIKHVTRFML